MKFTLALAGLVGLSVAAMPHKAPVEEPEKKHVLGETGISIGDLKAGAIGTNAVSVGATHEGSAASASGHEEAFGLAIASPGIPTALGFAS